MENDNLYEPYRVMENEDALLHLKLSKRYKIGSVIVSRILPLLILILVFLSVFLKEISINNWILAIILFVSISTIVLFQTSVGYEVYFNEKYIALYRLKLFGRYGKAIMLQDIDRIDLELFKDHRLSGAYYWLIPKKGRRILMLKFSSDYYPDEDRLAELAKSLETLTGLKTMGHTGAL